MFRLAPHLNRRARALAAAVAAATTLGLAAAPASAQQNSYWVVIHATGPYGLSPSFETRVTPPLPDGVTLEGRARCTRVYDPATGQGIVPSGGSLDVGVHQFVKSTCGSHPSDPLRLVGSSANLVINAGTWVVTPAQTRTDATAVVDFGPDNPSVTFSAAVVDTVADAVRLRGRTVTFRYERADGFWVLEACTGVTADSVQGIASCTLTGDEARRFIVGTGNWEAHFAGGRNHTGSAAAGRVPGTGTDPTAAANHLQNYLNQPENQVTIEKAYLPPACHNYADETSVSIIGISLGQMDCTQLKVLHILSGIAVGVALGPGQAATSAVMQVLENAAFFTAKLAAETAAKALIASVATPK